MTGGSFSETTEILQDKKWTVLANGNLPAKIYGLSLFTIDNTVFSFGKFLSIFISSIQHSTFKVVVLMIRSMADMAPYFLQS